jgi:hypothetical protein
MAAAPLLVVSRANLPVKSLQELLAFEVKRWAVTAARAGVKVR